MYRVNVSSIQDFMQCRFRWWCKWVMNRTPLNEMPALGAGKLLHLIFENAFNGKDISQSATIWCSEYRRIIDTLHPLAQAGQLKALQTVEDLTEALPLWCDTFPYDEVLEVEEPFEWEHNGILWRGRPDRTVLVGKNRIWHTQNRGLAPSMNFGTYTRLMKRHYHEHLYGEYLQQKYRKVLKRPKLKFGGTVANLVRKLKYRTNVGKKNEATKTAAEMFWQGAVSIEIDSPLHMAVMMAMEQHVRDMQYVEHRWRDHNEVPAPNEKMNGGFSGSSEDPYYKVLIGEIGLDDDNVFKAREDTYAVQETE